MKSGSHALWSRGWGATEEIAFRRTLANGPMQVRVLPSQRMSRLKKRYSICYSKKIVR
jgi:hypothetical protein